VTPARSLHPFGLGQSLNPYRHHYSTAFASSRIFYLHNLSAFLTVGLLWAFPQRVIQAYHVPQVAPTDGRRTPLYTGGYYTCGGRPLKSPTPDPRPLLGLEPLSRLSSAGVTMRNSEASLTVPIPVIPHSRSTVRLGFSTSAVCLRPPRCQGRPHRAGTEGTTSWLNHPFVLTFSSTTLRPRVAITSALSASGPTGSFRLQQQPPPGRDALQGRVRRSLLSERSLPSVLPLALFLPLRPSLPALSPAVCEFFGGAWLSFAL
jgi:hypothetical protein